MDILPNATAMSERKDLERQIRSLRKDIDIQLAYGDADAANRLLDKIAELECQIAATAKTPLCKMPQEAI